MNALVRAVRTLRTGPRVRLAVLAASLVPGPVMIVLVHKAGWIVFIGWCLGALQMMISWILDITRPKYTPPPRLVDMLTDLERRTTVQN